LLTVAACGDNSRSPANPDAGTDASVDIDARIEPPVTQYCRAISEVICSGLATCGCRFDTRAYDAAGCVEARTTSCVLATAAQASDVAAGRAEVEPVALARCVAALEGRATACEDVSSPPACRDALLSTAAIGATCDLAGGGLAFCADGAGVCGPGDGTCLALPASGQACLGGVVCGHDLACVGGTCAPLGAAGDACEPGSCGGMLVCSAAGTCGPRAAENAACTVDEQCATGLRCVQGDAGGTCEPGIAEGAGCRGPGQCGASRGCVPDPESRTCTMADSLGEPCETASCATGLACDAAMLTCVALPGVNQPCLDNLCAEGLTCGDGLGTCIELPDVGETCASGSRFCRDGLGCRESTNTCVVPPGAGQACVLNPPDALCAPGFGCDFDAGSICVARGDAGAPCTSDRGCVATTYCEVSTTTCTPRLAAGASCEDGNECQQGHECAFVAGAAVCRPVPTTNQPCLFDCADELACKGPGGECAPALCTVP
jgi:hypothetical protein